MATTHTTSGLFKLNWKDLARGLLVAAITAVIGSTYQALKECGISCIDWELQGEIALSAGLAYLIKNLFTPAEIVIPNADKETVQAVKEGNAQAMVTPIAVNKKHRDYE